MRYDAFVSYSHAVDGELAPSLQRGIQRLAKPWYRARALRVFRDETGLAVNPQLWMSIERALDDSEWFLVLCSPDAATSEWVALEIECWLARKPAERILLVLTDGDLVWDRTGGDFDISCSSALPRGLCGRFGDEPRHLDLRWARDEQQLDLRHSRFRSAVAEPAAPMHGMARDELEGEDLRQERWTVRLARGATTVLVLLLVLALALGSLALQQRGDARHQAANARREATAALAGKLAAESTNALHDSRNDLASFLAVEANRLDTSPAVRGSLLSALVDQPALERHLHGLSGTTADLVFSPDGETLAAADNREVMVWDVHTGQPSGIRRRFRRTGLTTPAVLAQYDMGSEP